jgi:hypothetical protein
MKIHSLENTGSISVDGVDIISLNPNGTIQLGTQTVYTAASYEEATATGGTITNQTIGNQIINGDLIVTGSLTAQQFIVSSSVTYLTTSFASGSTKFGDTLDDVHGFTGSLSISGSLIINGASYNTTTSGTSGTRGTSGSGGTSGSSGSSGESGIYIGTSTDTIDLSTLTVGVNKSLTTTVGLSYTIAQHVIVAYSLTEHFHGDVVSYNSGTGVLVLNVTDINTPTGTFSTWSTNLDGAAGGNGTSGTSGTNGTAGSGGTSGSSGVSGASGSSGATGSSGSAGTSGTSGTATTSTRVEHNFIATANQTTFTVTGGYTVGLVDVFVNGVRFLPTEYTATNGTTIVFDTGLIVNDEVTVLNYTSVIAALPTSRNVQDFTATSGQTTFTVTNGYIVGLLDVFVNGSKLTSSEFTATNGTTFVLTVASTVGDQVQSINYTASVNGVSGAGTTNQLAYYTASSTLSSLTTATYPSLTELSYVKGVTSAIQTQLNAKAATLSGTTNNIPKFTSSSAIGDSAITDDGTTVTLVSRALSGTTANFSSGVTGSTYVSNVTSGIFLSNSSGGTSATQLRINNTSGDLRLGIESSTGGTIQIGTLAYAAVFGNQANNATQFTTNGTARMTIASDGTKYLGTYNTSRLQINPTGENVYSYTNNYYIWGLYNDSNSLTIESAFAGNIIFRTAAQSTSSSPTTATERMRITSGGSLLMAKDAAIGINTSDGSDNGYLALCGAGGDGTNRGGHIYLSGNERPDDPGHVTISAGNVIGIGSVITFRTAGTERMRLIGNGRLLIGTSTDQGYLLYVNGNAAGSSGFANVSDGRFKKDITPIESALTKVNQLNGVSFNWDKGARPDLNLDDNNHLGLIAQDVEAILPQVVSTGDDTLQTKTITYSDIVPVLIEAIKELSAKVTLLENAQ